MLEAHTCLNTSLAINPVWPLSLARPRKVPDGDWFNVTCLQRCAANVCG